MFVYHTEEGIVGLTTPPDEWGTADQGEEATWIVEGESIQNLTLDAGAEKIASDRWKIQEHIGEYSDLLRVKGIRAVELVETNKPITVVENPEPNGTGPEGVRQWNVNGKVKGSFRKYEWSPLLRQPMVQAGLGVVGVGTAIGIAGRWLGWW